MTITCYSCGQSCLGEVLKVQEKHFHMKCFVCKECGQLLASGGYFVKSGAYYCSKDYHLLFGTKCKTCGDFVEGRVVTALGNSYHPQCFVCDRCKDEIHSGTVVTYNDRQEILCQRCTDIALNEEDNESNMPRAEKQLNPSTELSRSGSFSSQQEDIHKIFDFSKVPDVDPKTRTHLGKCAGCRESIRSCQSLIALERHWHLFCFTCSVCKKLLTSEYMAKGNNPYCEPCYQDMHGVACDGCQQFITGKVLEAGEKHFHPSCATCCRCSRTFAEGEDMCVSREDIWHLDCNRLNGRSESEYSSEDSRSHSRTDSISPTGTADSSRGRRSSSQLAMSRESSAGEPKIVYPLATLRLIGPGVRLPRGVNRAKLEQHLSDEDFRIALGMERDMFFKLQAWKQLEVKKKANLF
ncbi:actin-binding LIM protein 2-like [Halichondria panicea]|uniref:actin-binding LIM protein 2-like n=1 Tax=Halichondria panicea TaxID=6063 RepID=UPI00312B38E1